MVDQEYQEIINELNDYLINTYGQMVHTDHSKSIEPKTQLSLEPKVKEMVALSLGIAVRCEGCIGAHAKRLKTLGVTRDEILALLGMAVYIGGGPSMMYAVDALNVFSQTD
ncbi:carboxymuconolactone decarboxylase family protein [Thiotrichales bacterium 19S9-11]|nr:carboxymuconolactone decarboxylase family protein [Thiotrichales bacterium 19S9-11]